MHPGIKVLIGALMTVAGVYTSITFSDQLVTLVLGGLGPLLILVGAFIVWLESDEWKMKREESKEDRTNGLQEQLQNAQSMREQARTRQTENSTERNQSANTGVQRDYSEVLEGTVDEAKQAISEMEDPNYDALVAAERRDKNRKTLLEWLERRRD